MYWALVQGAPDDAALEALRQGIVIQGRRTREAEVALLPAHEQPTERGVDAPGPATWLRIVLREGRKRQIRHMTAAVGHPTLRLIRVALGPLALGDLAPGQWRALEKEELDALAQMLEGTG